MSLIAAEIGLHMDYVEALPGLREVLVDPTALEVMSLHDLLGHTAVLQSMRDIYEDAVNNPGVPFHDRRVGVGLSFEGLESALADKDRVLAAVFLMDDAWSVGCHDGIYREKK